MTYGCCSLILDNLGRSSDQTLHLPGRNESGTKKNNESKKSFVKTKEYVLRQNKYYLGGATCWSSNWLYKNIGKII